MVDKTKEAKLKVSLLTGGKDPHYALGLVEALARSEIVIDFIGNDAMEAREEVRKPNVTYFNLRGDQREDVSLTEKVSRVLKYYGRLVSYAIQTDAKVFHILWYNKFACFDQTLLNVFYRLLGKRLVHTVHNVNIGQRDSSDSRIRRSILQFMYRGMDHLFVHTEKMRTQLISDFNVKPSNITVIPFGINNAIPRTSLNRKDARERLGFAETNKVILFFGNIAPYKGLEYLVKAASIIKNKNGDIRLLIAGRVKNSDAYWEEIKELIRATDVDAITSERIEYVPDEQVELYFKAADVSVIPYTHIFQSGVLFLSYSFGLPVIASNVGSLKEDIVEGTTGLVCKPRDSEDLAQKLDAFFRSNMFLQLTENRERIIRFANEKHSWDRVGAMSCNIYRKLTD